MEDWTVESSPLSPIQFSQHPLSTCSERDGGSAGEKQGLSLEGRVLCLLRSLCLSPFHVLCLQLPVALRQPSVNPQPDLTPLAEAK